MTVVGMDNGDGDGDGVVDSVNAKLCGEPASGGNC